MSSLPGIKETLALLDRLRNAVRETAAREEKLESDYRARSAAEERAYAMAFKEHEARQTDLAASEEERFQAAEHQHLAAFERRKVRINEAHKNARRQALSRIGDEEGRRKHRLQQNAIEAERRRDAGLGDSAVRFEKFKQNLAATAQTYASLEQIARTVFRGYRRFRKLLDPQHHWPEPDLSADEDRLLQELRSLQTKTADYLKRFGSSPLPLLFRILPFWLLALLLLGFAAAAFFTRGFGHEALLDRQVGLALLAFALVLAVYQLGQRQSQASATTIAGDLAKARWLQQACSQKAEMRHQQDQERLKSEFETTSQLLDAQFRLALREAMSMRDLRPPKIDQKAQRCSEKTEEFHRLRLQQLEREHNDALVRLEQEAAAQSQKLAQVHEEKLAKINADHQVQWHALETEWKTVSKAIYDEVQAASAAAAQLFPEWQLSLWEQWTPPAEFTNAAKFGSLTLDLDKFAGTAAKDKRLALPGFDKPFCLPLLLTYPYQGSILFETGKAGSQEALSAINNIIFRLLSTAPPGKVSFTIFDPIGLGQNFAGLMHLADFEQSHINSRIWTQTTQLEEKLAELTEHMEKVIQMYLRNEYATIAEYNAQAGAVAEKYHFLVVAGFPVNFSDTAGRRLLNIAASGARCGVYTLIHWDQRQPLPQDFVADDLRKNCVGIVGSEKGCEIAAPGFDPAGTQLRLDLPPSPEFATQFLRRVGEAGIDSNRVEVPFAQVAPTNSNLWTEETTQELRVPIGRSGATKLQYLAIGKGTRQHALIAGKTGSGKSTLFHVIITNLALWCSPEQVEFYLVDFKKGVEFKCYATRRLPHARVVAIESDRGFGLSVLERVDAELRRRGDLFRKCGVQDIAGYKRAGGTEPVPRSLLMIDEFQEFFVEEDRISQGASVLLDRIVRQGRAFGIHVLLGSQTLGGAYTLARATIGQMVIRIALQCNEADAYLIMDQDNPAPRLLSRPGEGIYNDAAGSIEGNSPFQAVWLPDDVRDTYLAAIRQRADADNPESDGEAGGDSALATRHSALHYPGPFVFEGNAPADVRENALLNAALDAGLGAPPSLPAGAVRVWLGSPNSIKGPTEAVFQKQSGSNLLMVGQNEEASLTLLAVALISLAAQYPLGTVRFVVLEATPPSSPHNEFLQRVFQAIPHEVIQARNRDLTETLGNLAEDLKQRTGDVQAASRATFLLIHGLQNFKKLRQEDEFSFSSAEPGAANPAALLMNLITEGPSHGIHVIATFDAYNNVTRCLGRKALSEFEMRVLFQMSAGDSASLIDAPDAGTLGMYRALLYNEREGYLETFRPYALPPGDWLEEVARRLSVRRGKGEEACA